MSTVAGQPGAPQNQDRPTYQPVLVPEFGADGSRRARVRALVMLDAAMLLIALVLVAAAHPAVVVEMAVFTVFSFALLALSVERIQRSGGGRFAASVDVGTAPIVMAVSGALTLAVLWAPWVHSDAAWTDSIVPWLLATAYVVAGRAAFAWATSTEPVANVTHVLDLVTKRIFDVVVASVLLVVTAPVAALVAIAIRLEDRGPVLYRCQRVGEHGKNLEMLKFRKMRHGATGPPLTLADDDRLTRVGRYLARSKLDELPQLWNVLRGQMSLVGPRPEDPEFVGLYPREYATIGMVRPGITGLCQLAFAKESQIIDGEEDTVQLYADRFLPQKLSIDLLYAQHRTFVLDLKILCWTMLVLLRRDVAVHRQTGGLTVRRRREDEESTARAA